ncbi:MAG: hypothetical protein JWM93_3595 [Frankiales bacterium]|nr:hypothetical protein [Frankiales bacterium]
MPATRFETNRATRRIVRGVSAVLLVGGLGACAPVDTQPTESPQATGTSQADQATKRQKVAAVARVSRSLAAVDPTTGKIVTSDDRGKSWKSEPPLPADVAVGDIADIHRAKDKTTWLGVGRGQEISLYRSAGDTWTMVKLKKTVPADSIVTGVPSTVIFADDGNSLVATASLLVGRVATANSVFRSADRGQSFIELMAPLEFNIPWRSADVTADGSTIIVGGPLSDKIIRVASDGKYSFVNLAGLGMGAALVGDPRVDQATVEISVVESPEGSPVLVTYVSRDDGQKFTRLPGVLKLDGEFGGAIATAAVAGVRWYVPSSGGGVFKQEGSGEWVSSDSNVPAGATRLVVFDQTTALLVVPSNGCDSFKSDCWSREQLWATGDGGASWAAITA